MLMDPGDFGRIRVKTDVLYKPLLRGFRCYYRTLLSEKLMQLYNSVGGQQAKAGEKNAKTSANLATRRLEKVCADFLIELQAPQELWSSKVHLHSLIIMILPFTANNMQKRLVKLPRVLKNLPKLIEPFCSIFRENSKGARWNFFSNRLIQFLWTHYIRVDESSVIEQFSELIKVEDNCQSEAATLLKDILVLSNRLKFQILTHEFVRKIQKNKKATTVHH